MTAISSLFFACFALAYGCGGDDSNGALDSNDGGPDADATANQDSSSRDAAEENAVDAAAASHVHVIFATSRLFNGDLLAAAASIATDAGLDSGGLALADGGGKDYVVAGDVICAQAAADAKLPGKYTAMLTTGSGPFLSNVTDADGPWALVDGTPVADSVAQLTSGAWYVPVVLDESGNAVTDDPWTGGISGIDCRGWSSADGTDEGAIGISAVVGPNDSLAYAGSYCHQAGVVRCVEVGSGGAKNHFPALASGAKIAFVTDGVYPGNLALSDAGVIVGDPPDAGDAVHSVADAICNQTAASAGRSGTFHAWVSSSGTSAKDFFAAHGMTGPWVRPDGIEITPSLDALSAALKFPIDLSADGGYQDTLSFTFVWTGTLVDGGTAANCNDFTSNLSTDSCAGGERDESGLDWQAYKPHCVGTNRLFCFQE
ncbi:MAG: hypothetical protein ABI183_06490 [Polyangiaceae bacterium]